VNGTLELGARIVEEIGLLPEVFGARLVLWVTLVFLATFTARAAVLAGVRLAWRLGFDRQRRLGRFAAIVRVVLWLVGALLVLRPVFVAVPVLTTLATVITALLFAVAMPGHVQSIAAGLSLALLARYREGDQIEVGGHRGSIRSLGLVRTQLRVEDGSSVWLPNAVLDHEAVKVDRSTGAAPVRVRIEIDLPERERVLEEITAAVTLMPLRRAGSAPRIVATSEDERTYTVELQTWATRELDLARKSLRRTVDAVLARYTGGAA
jgi:small conductance mechanosensitive channel